MNIFIFFLSQLANFNYFTFLAIDLVTATPLDKGELIHAGLESQKSVIFRRMLRSQELLIVTAARKSTFSLRTAVMPE